MDEIADEPTGHLTIQLLRWVAEKPRTYGEAMEAWRTNCPLMPIWEDAISGRLIRLEPGGSMRQRRVNLTPAGEALLDRHSAPRPRSRALMDS